jgi:hypothetical protein
MAMFLTILVTLVVGVVGLEIVFRLFVPVVDVPFSFWDPVVGIRREPNQSGRMLRGRYVDGHYRFNAQGWNNEHDYATIKPPGVRRICVVGDSQVQAYEVDVGKTFFSLAERAMSTPQKPTQWYSFGCSGFGPAQEESVIRHYVLDYHPDLVILLFVENDPHDSSPYIFPVENFTTSYYLDEASELILMPPKCWKPNWYRRMGAASALVRYFTIQKDVLRAQGEQAHELGEIYLREPTSGKANLQIVPGLDKMTVEQREAATWVLVEKILARVRDECRNRGAKFAIVWRGNTRVFEAALRGEDYHPAPREKDPYCLGRQRLFEMAPEYLEPMARKLGVPYLDLTEPIRKRVAETRKSHAFPDDGHWNADTHAVVAGVLAEWAEGLLPRS